MDELHGRIAADIEAIRDNRFGHDEMRFFGSDRWAPALTPLHAQRAYDAPEEAQLAAGGSSVVAPVVDNEGGDLAA